MSWFLSGLKLLKRPTERREDHDSLYNCPLELTTTAESDSWALSSQWGLRCVKLTREARGSARHQSGSPTRRKTCSKACLCSWPSRMIMNGSSASQISTSRKAWWHEKACLSCMRKPKKMCQPTLLCQEWAEICSNARQLRKSCQKYKNSSRWSSHPSRQEK